MRRLRPPPLTRVLLFGFEITALDVPLFLTLVLLEGVLSFDNAAILAALVRKLPPEQRRKALLYGIGGAYFFRLLAIVGVTFIIANQWLKIVGGAYLVYLAAKHFLAPHPHQAVAIESRGLFARFRLSGFWSVVLAVELADIAFALDQILVAVAMTDKVPIIVLAAFSAILLLRIAAGYMTRLMDWFPQLEGLAYAAVAFVGAKLIVVESAHRLGFEEFDVPKEVSVAVTLSLIVLPVVVKFVLERFFRPRASA